MSRKSLLNVTSTKKRNNALPINFDYLGGSPSPGGANIFGNNATFKFYCPTMMDREGDATSNALRTANPIFLRGIKENITLGTTTAAAWEWRRIVFACKSLDLYVPGIVGNVETSRGWSRGMVDLTGPAPTTIRNALEAFLFQGLGGTDWWSVWTAKVDTNRCRVLYDRTRTLSSGNSNGRFFKHRQWIPVNHNIYYDEDERGKDQDSRPVSVADKRGFGDVFIYDMFRCQTESSTDRLIFEPEAVIYWHEK